MSRCFPFPPPGYVKKARTDEVDLLKKEKQKEKKHKKEKREKEKRESKEKREKEGRDGKPKEKKDKKEKHREKKKDKDKSKDRDKSKIGIADDKVFPRQVEGPNAGKLHQKDIKQDDKKGILSENTLIKQYTGNNVEKARDKNHLAEENKDSKFLLELDRRLRDDDGGVGNQLVHKFTNTDHRKDEGTVRLVAKGGGTRLDGNEKPKDKGLDAKKIDGRGIQAEVRPIGNAPVQNDAGSLHPRVDGIPKLLGKYFERNLEATVEGKEKVKEKKDEVKEKVKERKDEEKEKAKEKTEKGKVKEKKDEGKEKVKGKKDDKRRDKRKDREKEKKGHGKDKDRDKEKKKEEKAKEHSELKTTEQNKLKESNKIGLIDTNSFTKLSKNNHDNAVSGENLKKRKDIESNGVPRANDSCPNKFPRLSSSHPVTENGSILEPCQISIPNASDRPGVATSVKVENNECKINGIIEAHQPFAASSKKPHTATVPADLVTEASAKPPHPDTKYLNQVYSVPKVEQWSDFGDQEWLFGSNVSQERKSVVESSEVGEKPQVWAEALHLESADVFALPYVIPY